MYIIKKKQTSLQDPSNPLLIQKEFLQNRFCNYNVILQQQPTDLYSEIILQGLLLNKVDKQIAINYLLLSDPTKFAFQYAQYCCASQLNQPILKFIFFAPHQQFLQHSLDIVLKSQITKREIMAVTPNYTGEITIQEIEQILNVYPKFNSLAAFYLKCNPNFMNNHLIVPQIKRSELFNKNVETLLYFLLECDDKQAITEILLNLSFYNDTIINLGILMSTDEMQFKEEQLYFEKWTQSKVYKKKMWYRFSVLVQQKLIRLENMEFTVCNLNFQQPLLIKALFSLVRRHTSNFIIENAASPEIKQYAHYFLVFPEFFKIFFIDYAQLLDEDYNNLILKSLNVTLTHIEKTRSQQEVFNLKLFLCQFLIQCVQKMNDKTKTEINIYQFLQQLLIKDKHLILQFVSELQLDQIEKAVKNIDCLHIVSSDLNLLTEKIQNKEKLLKFCQSLQQKHKRELVDKILEQYVNEKGKSISTNQIMTKKEEKLIVQLY